MHYLDGHCDVLYKMWQYPQAQFYRDDSLLDVTYDYLCQSNTYFQTFAIFVPTTIPKNQRFHVALSQIDLFYTKVLSDDFTLITRKENMFDLPRKRGAFLALEGADALSGEISYLRHFYRLGVRQVGLTWNFANEVADGIREDRGGGLSLFGKQVVSEMEKLGMILDVSHLSVKGFWEVIERDTPVLASHSNAKHVCSHIRNLDDEQIEALIRKQGLIGITFVPKFVHKKKATINSIIQHIDHICSLGGEDHLFFGSDFDGIEEKIPNIENLSQLKNLMDALLKRFDEKLVRKWFFENGYQFYRKHLL